MQGVRGAGCNQRTVCGDGFPQGRTCRYIAFRTHCSVVVGDDVDLAVHQTSTSLPFPDITFHILNAELRPVVAPRCRAGTSKGAARIVVILCGFRPALMGVCFIAAVVAVAVRHRLIFAAPQRDTGPFCQSAQVEACAFGLTSLSRIVEIDIRGRVAVCQRVGTAIDDDVLILGIVERVLFHAVHGERRMNIFGAARNELGHFQAVNRNIDGRQIHVIQQNDVFTARQFLDGCGHLVIVCHIRVLLTGRRA